MDEDQWCTERQCDFVTKSGFGEGGKVKLNLHLFHLEDRGTGSGNKAGILIVLLLACWH